ncbi:MAG: glycosyltransferase [Pseudoxanthomonas sp.]
MTAVLNSSGILVLGMHRSGTSAMARVLGLGGANIGARVLGASAGNEIGHWEDALAVEIHERLLAGLGCRWDDAFGLPRGWQDLEPAARAREEIRAYLTSNRSRHRLWAIKDPRLSFFAGLWRSEAEALGIPLGAIVMLRHPAEVAASLGARDGIAPTRAMFLWLEYTTTALAEAQTLPSVMLRMDHLLDDWRGCAKLLAELPGGNRLRFDAAASAAVDAYLAPSLRHYDVRSLAEVPHLFAEAWTRLAGIAGREGLLAGAVGTPPGVIEPIRELLHPLFDEFRVTIRQLWGRVERAEGQLAIATESLPASLDQLGQRMEDIALEGQRIAAGQDRLVSEASANAIQAVQAREAADRAVQASEAVLPEVAAVGASLVRVPDRIELALTTAAGDLVERQRDATDLLTGELTRMRDVTDAAFVGLAAGTERASKAAAERAASTDAKLELLGSAAAVRAASTDAKLELLASAAAAHAASADAKLEMLASIVPRHEEALAALATARHTLSHTHAELQATDQAFVETRGILTATVRELGVARGMLAAVRAEHEALGVEHEARGVGLASAAGEIVALRSELTTLAGQLRERSHLVDAISAERDRMAPLVERLDRVLVSRSWRITRPLRVAVRLLTGRWSKDDSSRLRAIGRGVISRIPFLGTATRERMVRRSLRHEGGRPVDLPDQSIASLILLPLAQPDLPDVFVWAVIDWHFRIQRPQHLARALAEKGHRVFYVSVNFIDDWQAGFRVEPLDAAGRLHQVHLNLRGAPQIYASMPMANDVSALKSSLGRLLEWTGTQAGVSIIQHPYWSELARSVPNVRVVYDCMDHHGGFENNSGAVLDAENALVRDSDLVIVTSGWLQQEFEGKARSLKVIRNAGEYAAFAERPAEVFADELGRKIIGYYGAIAEWFDWELVHQIALKNPDALVLLVGHDSVGVRARLEGLPNVRLVGEVPYTRLPYWLHAFDLCLLPFQVIPLTLATNPVKVYEYLAAGKPVVAVDLPEMAQFGKLVQVAHDQAGFLAAVARELATSGDAVKRRRRQAFAARQTWAHRADALDEALRALVEPRVSVVVLTYNNLSFTKACLDSIESYSDYAELEVIVVDNASSDGSREYLVDWVAQTSAAGHSRRLLLNDANLGFAAGNNVGLRVATGDVLVMLNNDTYVTPGWVRSLCNHLRRNPRLGLVGPVTNNIGNEARIEIDYADMAQMISNAGRYTRRHPGREHAMKTVAFFCVALPRAVYQQIGGLDEDFGQGFFEDDDYCRRAEAAGWQIACAEDVFVHHHLSASFNQVQPESRAELFRRNKAIYEGKWGAWQPHAYRQADQVASGQD